jgi:hypothetical protein
VTAPEGLEPPNIIYVPPRVMFARIFVSQLDDAPCAVSANEKMRGRARITGITKNRADVIRM